MIDLMFLKHSAEQLDGIDYAEMTIEPKTVLALLDMLEAAKQNAARYEWLRGALADSVNGVSHHFCSIRSADELDSAIDVAMAETKGEEA